MSIFGGIGSVVGADIIAYVKLSGADTFNRDLDKLNASAGSFGKMMNATMNAAVIGAGVAFVGASAAAIQFESSFAGVLKTTDGLTDSLGNINAEGVALSEEFRKLALEIPLSVNELNRIGELGGQLGIAKESLITFTSVIAQLGTTTDLSYEQGAMAIAQFINVTKSVVPAGVSVDEQLEKIASTLVDLGNNSVATESQIMEFAQRLAGAGAVIGLSQDEILSFGAALASVGVNAEAGGTAFSKLFIEMKSAVETGGDDLRAFADAAHISMTEFKTLFEQDASAALVKFIEGLGETQRSGGSVIGVLKDLGIEETRMRSAILLASGAGDLLNETLNTGKTAYSENAAMAEEFAKRTATTESQLILLKNAVMDILIELGQNFLPMIRSVAETLAEHPTILSNILILLMGAGGIIAAFKMWTAAHEAWITISTSSAFVNFANTIKGTQVAQDLLTGSMVTQLAKATLLAGAITFTADQLIKLVGAIKGVIDANKILDEANALSETMQKRVADAVLNTDNIYRQLMAHSGDEMVNFNGKVMTVNEALKLFSEASMNAALNGATFATEMTISFDKTNIASTQATASAEAYKKKLEELKGVGIETSAQIQDQITKLENLRYAFINDSVVTSDLSSKIAELRLKLDPTGQSLEKMVYTSVDLEAKNKLASIGFVELGGAVTNTGDRTKDAKYEWAQYSQLIHEITEDMGPLGDVVNIVADSVVSASSKITTGNMSFSALFSSLDPLTLGLNLASFAVGLFGEEEKKIVYTTEEVIDRVYGADSAMAEFISTVNDLTLDAGQFDIVDAATEKFKLLEEQLTFAYNRYGSLSLQVKFASDALEAQRLLIEGLTTSFEFLDKELLIQSTYLSENITQALEYYGNSIPMDKVNTWLALLAENTAKLQEQSGLLAVGSQAWKDNEAAINANNYIIGLLSGTWTDFGGYVASANLDIEAASRFLSQMGLEGEALDNALLELGFTTLRTADNTGTLGQEAEDAAISYGGLVTQIDEINAEIEIWQGKLDAAKTKQAEINSVLEESTKRFNEQKAAIQSNIDTWQSELDAIDKEINWNIDLTPPTLEEIGTAMQELNDKILAASEEMAAIEIQISGLEAEKQEAIDAYIASLDILISKAGELEIAWGDSVDTTIANFETLFGSGSDSWTNKALAAIEQLKYFKIDLDTTDADESIAGTIVKMQEYLGTLAPGSPAYIAASDSLNNLITQYGTLGTAFSTEVGVNFNNEAAISGIAEIDTSYEDQIEKLQTQQLVIAVNMLTYNQALQQMKVSYETKLAELNARKLVVQADITGAETTLAALQRNYDNLRAALQAQYIAVSANTSAASQAIYYLRQELASLTANPYVVNITANSNLPTQHTGGMLYHSGGLVAHNGMMLGQYGTLREVPFTGLEGEYVLNPNIGRKFGEAALDAFNVSGNPAVLGAESRQTQPTVELKPEFTIMNAAPETFVTWTDKYIHPRIRDNDDRQIKSDRFK